jgi:peptidoglycan/LPS O-acetylase OafA/YrhL
MIDVYRFILAICVVQGHLLGPKAGAPWLAWQAVFSFYVLSGFLMSLVLNQNYGFTSGGLVRFAVNRWLRLFPVYYAVIGLTAFYIMLVGPLNQLNNAITLPSTGAAIFAACRRRRGLWRSKFSAISCWQSISQNRRFASSFY